MSLLPIRGPAISSLLPSLLAAMPHLSLISRHIAAYLLALTFLMLMMAKNVDFV